MQARSPLVYIAVLALVGCVIPAKAEQPPVNAQLAGKCADSVVAPGMSLLGRLSKAVADGLPADSPTRQQTAAEADRLSATGWLLLVEARERWRATGSESDFQFYLSIADAVSATDHLSMFPRTGDETHLDAARARFASSQQAARTGAQLAQVSQASQPAPAMPKTPAVTPAAPAAAPVSDVVYVTAQGSKFHRAGCRYLKGGGRAMSKADALAAGYMACKVCKP